jgi:hypothetical protein
MSLSFSGSRNQCKARQYKKGNEESVKEHEVYSNPNEESLQSKFGLEYKKRETKFDLPSKMAESEIC